MRILTTVVFLSIGINVFAQDVEINLCDFNQPIVGTRYIARPVCYDSTGKYATFTINEILFDIKAESGNNHFAKIPFQSGLPISLMTYMPLNSASTGNHFSSYPALK